MRKTSFRYLLAWGMGLALIGPVIAWAQENKPEPPPRKAGEKRDEGPRPNGPRREGQPRRDGVGPGEPSDNRPTPPIRPDRGPGGAEGREGFGDRAPGERGTGAPGGLGGPPRPGEGREPRFGGPREPQRPGEFGPGRGPGGGGPGIGGPYMDWEQLKKNDPELYELEISDQDLERKTYEASNQFRRADKAQREDLQKQIQDLVGKHFEVRQKRRQLTLERLEKELQKLREELTRRSESREQIVTRRLAELTGERGELDF